MYEVDPIIITFGDEEPEAKSMLDDIRALRPLNTHIEEDKKPIILSSHKAKKKEKKKKKKKDISLTSLSDDMGLITVDDVDGTPDSYDRESRIIDIDAIVLDSELMDVDESDKIVKAEKKGYKKLKNGENVHKKEFAEEITLLYSLLDETTKYGKDLEKDLNSIRSSKVRGVSKYSNDLASLVLTAKQTKLNILKEIASVKKTVADLGIKENKGNNKTETAMTSESLASQYFRNILSHGRTEFIDTLSSDDLNAPSRGMLADMYSDNEEDIYTQMMEDRLTNTGNPYRSSDGSKYIEYEHRGIEIRVNKCIDTGEWDFIAVDKVGQIVDDYPLPEKRTAGRMRFSDDGGYATDDMGRMYKVVEYYLPAEYDDDDDDDE